ncbi:alpha/beta hydrolase [Hyphobacterium sp. HN65]|uniref:Alpha/beta hydrolase n=1 Tax=Hyphobacterium lacteum TaxID=3116575 RepID=A0ABU7LPI5_9PROT|nr:alpha/beta hydrolase [Hyphobacterium sp. HN65]MEE2525812.1 alpha/beta hydrolase [Hyphobacterium sp. HN65]
MTLFLALVPALDADDMPPSGSFIEIDDARIRFVAEGDGPPVVLLHGASSNAEDMRMALSDTLDGYRAIYVDRPGLGWSERPSGDWSPEREAALLARLIGELDLESPAVIGHSWGGAISMRLAIDHPDTISGLVLIGAPLYSGVGEAAWYNRASRWFGIGPLITRVIVPLVGPGRLDDGLAETFHPAPVPEGYGETVQARRIFRTDIFKANAEDMAQVNAHLARQELLYPSIQLPVVMLAGSSDEVVYTQRHAVPAAGIMPNARTVIREDWGHMLHHQSPDAVRDALDSLHRAGDN